MNKIITLIMCLGLLAPTVSAKGDVLNGETIQKLKEKYAVNKFFKIKMPGLLSFVSPKGSVKSVYYSMTVDLDCRWGTRKWTPHQWKNTVFEVGEEVFVSQEVDASGKSVEIFITSTKAHSAGKATAVPCTTAMYFEVVPTDTFDTVLARISKFVDDRDGVAAAANASTKSLKIGMTVEEVVQALGDPKMKADMGGGKIVYKYADMVITFQDGKVSNIEFK